MEIRQIYSDHLESTSDEQCETHPEAMPLVELQHQPINILIGKNFLENRQFYSDHLESNSDEPRKAKASRQLYSDDLKSNSEFDFK